MPHDFVLSPLENPWAYLVFAIRWLSSFVCIAVSIYFYRRKKETWWLVIALAFILPLVETTVRNFLHGVPPLPYGTVYSEGEIQPARRLGFSGGSMMAQPRGTDKIMGVTIYWDSITPMMALALGWAYLADRKKRADNPPTA